MCIAEAWSACAGHAAERTLNIDLMSVTLDVSRLSGWLKADARLNMARMVVTPEVSQLDKPALKFGVS